jgi:centromere-localized protein 2
MVPTEKKILTSFLLPPAPLSVILPLSRFTTLFPVRHRSNRQIPLLYRDLQYTRALDTDHVASNIAAEAKRGEGMAREVVRTRRRDELGVGAGFDAGLGEEADREMLIEGWVEQERSGALVGEGPGKGRVHTVASVIPAMEKACRDLEEEIAELETEAMREMAGIDAILGDLTDLRYGKFALPVVEGEKELGGDVLEGLAGLREGCERVNGGGNEDNNR